jgi:spore germination protein GerM
MTRGRLIVGGIVLALVAAGLFVATRLERWVPPQQVTVEPPRPAGPEATARITATLFYGSVDGQALVPFRREVELADTVVAQGTHILTAQLGPAPAPLVSVVPKGTALRSFYVTDRGDAFVDLSPEMVSAHPGGSLMELLTVYAIVNAVTANLPKVQRVQILVNGRELETLAGHVDLRRPLARDRSLVREK